MSVWWEVVLETLEKGVEHNVVGVSSKAYREIISVLLLVFLVISHTWQEIICDIISGPLTCSYHHFHFYQILQ